MGDASETSKCSCAACGVHLEFPLEMIGAEISCPQCNERTVLAGLDIPIAPAVEERPGLAIEQVLGAFKGQVNWQRTSFFYQVGLLLVTLAIMVLPVLYLAFVAGAGLLVGWWARAGTALLRGPMYGIYFFLLKLMVYLTPLVVGSTVFFFLLKPLLARRPPRAQPLALNPASEPLLFEFITRICKTIGAPFPARIDIDCQLNASAGFRRGFKSIFGNDLVLTLGLPLVAGMTVTQLGAVIAHEFGHFTQGFAMRLTYIISRVNGWFARVVYERDQWDLTLEEWALEAQEWQIQLMLAMARLGVWFSRLLLKLLMFAGVGISSFFSRQMEYDADRYEIEFAGSRAFEEIEIRLAMLSALLKPAYAHMRTTWNTNNTLPDDFPAFLLRHYSRLPDETRTAIADRVGLLQAGLFSTHPASGDRIRCARRANKPGVFSVDEPATALFTNFEAVARQVTLLHYSDDLGITQLLIRMRPVETFFETSRTEMVQPEPVEESRAAAMKAFGPAKLKLKTAAKKSAG
jgi:hypothetical protein